MIKIQCRFECTILQLNSKIVNIENKLHLGNELHMLNNLI